MVAALSLTASVARGEERWFQSTSVACDSFSNCAATLDFLGTIPDSLGIHARRSGEANAALDIQIRVNAPVEGGVPTSFEADGTVLDLAPGSGVVTRRETEAGKERVIGYFLAPGQAATVVELLRRSSSFRVTTLVEGRQKTLALSSAGLTEALRYMDERQGRAGAQDALVDKGSRDAADAAKPGALPERSAWPKEIEKVFKGERCEDTWLGDLLPEGFVAAPAPGRELWQIPCRAGNYEHDNILIEWRKGGAKAAQLLTFPTRTKIRDMPRSRSGAGRMARNSVWQEARRELWTFAHFHAHGDCGVAAHYRWTERGFLLLDERRKDDCDSKFVDPFTQWPKTRAGP